jgi:hypothetical protein
VLLRGGNGVFEGGGRRELSAPDGEPGGFLHRFLAAHGPGVHHVTFKVPDLHAARDRARSLGFDVIGFRDDQPAWKECFLHPKQIGGIVVQMAEVDPDFDDDDWQPFAPVFGGTPRRSVSLVGPRLVSRDRDRSHRVWAQLLGGSVATTNVSGIEAPEQTFRWPDSPLSIRVLYDANAANEGSVALELQEHDGTVPPELSRLLGAAFAQV